MILVFICRGVWLTIVVFLGINAPTYNLNSVGGSSLLTWIFRFHMQGGLMSLLGLCGLTPTLITLVFILFILYFKSAGGVWLTLVLYLGLTCLLYLSLCGLMPTLITWVFNLFWGVAGCGGEWIFMGKERYRFEVVHELPCSSSVGWYKEWWSGYQGRVIMVKTIIICVRLSVWAQ